MDSRFGFYIFLIAFMTLLVSCGGGGDNEKSTGQIIAISSSSQSAITSPAVLAPDDQIFTLDEDTILSSDIKVNLGYVSARGVDYMSSIPTLKNGVVQILPFVSVDDPKVYFKYTPAEDFYGDDECIIYLTKSNDAAEPDKQKIKIHFHVLPVADENFKFNILNKKVFIAGDQVRLSLPYDPDIQDAMPSNTNFKLSVDNLLVDYSVNTDEFSFIMPTELVAGLHTVNVQLEYHGKLTNVTRTFRSKIDYGDVEYWMGDKGRPGATYIVIAEQRVDRQKYLDWVNKELVTFLSEPIIAQYSDYWNFAVIKQLAPENYASLINENKSSIVIASLQESGEAFIKRFVPNYDWVILNTSLEGRETGGYPMVLRFSPVTIILHEFGHVHAKLADEYADTTIASVSSYVEGSNPNVSNFNNYESIPWKHWILDKTNIPGVNAGADSTGVGAFLGALYTDNKFYRPMLLSIMRDTNAPMGPVYSEAWLLATYEQIGILGSVTNTRNANLRTINVAKNWNKNLTRIDWFLNDVKQDAWTNQSTVVIDENKIAATSYSIKAELTDLSGYIKNPHAYSAFKLFNHPDIKVGSTNGFDGLKDLPNENFQKQWIFEKSSSTSIVKLQKQSDQSEEQTLANSTDWVSHKIAIENGVHHLVLSSRYELQDTLPGVTAHSEFRADVIDASGRHIFSVGIDNPYRYYHDERGLVILKGSGNYSIKHPYVKGNYQIEIVDIRANQRVATLNFSQ